MVEAHAPGPSLSDPGGGQAGLPVGVAERIRAELEDGPTSGRVAKMTSLLRAFRADSNVAVVQNQVVDQLRDAGVHVEEVGSGAAKDAELPRSALVTLSVDGSHRPDTATSIRTEIWRATDVGLVRSTDLRGEPGKGVAWIDVSFSESSVHVNQLHQALELVRPEAPVTDEMLTNLLCPDERPTVTAFGDESSGIRGLSVVAVIARQQATDQGTSIPPLEILLQPIELLVGPDWLVSCWQAPYQRTTVAPRRFGKNDAEAGQLLHEPFLARVQQDLQDRAASPLTAGDLALDFVRGVVDTYDASLRVMSTWTSRWRRFATTSTKRVDAHPITQLAAMVNELASDACGLLDARQDTWDRTWVASLSDTRLGDEGRSTNEAVEALSADLERFLKKVGDLERRVDADLQSAVLRASERLQDVIAVVTGVLLVPTLVVGFFGANTALPGKESWSGFVLMMLLIVASVAAAMAYWRSQKSNR